MSPDFGRMDHAAAHERLADLALEPPALEQLATELDGAAPDAIADAALLEHVRRCPSCLASLDAARRLDRGLHDALGALPAGERLDLIEPPAGLRAAVLAAAHGVPRAAPTASSRAGDVRASRWSALVAAISRPAWPAAVAALVVVALLSGLAGSRLQQLGGESSADSLVGVVSTVERVLESPEHRVVPLVTAAGAPAGSVAWSRQDFAVLASSLAVPPSGQVYRCWLVWDGAADEIGQMDFAGSTAYWTGTTGSWASVTFEPGTTFEVTLESGLTAGSPQGQPVLSASLGS